MMPHPPQFTLRLHKNHDGGDLGGYDDIFTADDAVGPCRSTDTCAAFNTYGALKGSTTDPIRLALDPAFSFHCDGTYTKNSESATIE